MAAIKEEYVRTVNRLLHFIDENLGNELSLESLSKVGFYSPFHLHRLFKTITNEALNAYITRKRIEKAASLLIHRKEMSITELAMLYGFSSNSSFTRAFKKYYGVSPSDFRRISPNNYSKIRQVESKNGQVGELFEAYICDINHLKNWIQMNAAIEITELPAQEVAFITQIGVEGLENAFSKLIKWANVKRLMDNPACKIVRIYHDSFKITSPDKVRMSVGITLPEPISVSGEVGLILLGKGSYIKGYFEIEPLDFEKAWTSLYVWMNEKGYTKADQTPFEIIHNNFNEHPEKKCLVDLYIPIE